MSRPRLAAIVLKLPAYPCTPEQEEQNRRYALAVQRRVDLNELECLRLMARRALSGERGTAYKAVALAWISNNQLDAHNGAERATLPILLQLRTALRKLGARGYR